MPLSRYFAAKKKDGGKDRGKDRPPSSRGSGRKSARRLKLFTGRLLRWVRNLTLAFLLSTVLVTLLFGVLPPPVTPLMLIRCGEQLFGDDPLRLSKDWTSLDDLSPHLLEAVVAAEDQRFFHHRGFDWESIVDAFTINLKGKRKLGASTISQQTAKNLFLWPDRSWIRKGLEAYFTLLMETLWTKRRILTVYLNVIETGKGVYGVEAAAQEYFGVPASRLSRHQAALIAAVLPNPRRWSPARPTPYIWARQAWILRQMELRGSLIVPRQPGKIRSLIKRIIGLIV